MSKFDIAAFFGAHTLNATKRQGVNGGEKTDRGPQKAQGSFGFSDTNVDLNVDLLERDLKQALRGEPLEVSSGSANVSSAQVTEMVLEAVAKDPKGLTLSDDVRNRLAAGNVEIQ